MELNKYIEHTLLKPEATKAELIKLFNEAIQYKFKGVCVNPVNVPLAKECLQNTDVKIVTVVGFPLGASKSEIKAQEAASAINDGADEIDMVINVSAIKDNNIDVAVKDIAAVKAVCKDKNLKVIIETDLLTDEEKILACEACIKGGADFVKTSTGFVKNGVGAKVEDIELIKKSIVGTNLKIKASGGIRDKEKAVALINAGASRLGTSSGVKIVE